MASAFSGIRHGPCRKPTLVDLMILIGATALGFGLIRWSRIDVARLFQRDPHYGPLPRRYLSSIVHRLHYTVVPFLASWTLGMLVIRLRRPRPERRRLFRQPGAAALAAATLTVVAEAVWLVGHDSHRAQPMMISVAFSGWEHFCAFAVFGAWLTLALSGCWRGERGWIDRSGTCLGAAWIGTLLTRWAHDIAFGP